MLALLAVRSPVGLTAAAVVATTLAACSYGARAGLRTAGMIGDGEPPIVLEGAVTGHAGFGSTHRDGSASDGFHETLTLALGPQSLSLLGGAEYYRIPERREHPWGFRVGVDVGFRKLFGDAGGWDYVALLRGGPALRLNVREGAPSRPLLQTLEAALLLGAAFDIEHDPPTRMSVIVGLGVEIAFTDVGPFHL